MTYFNSRFTKRFVAAALCTLLSLAITPRAQIAPAGPPDIRKLEPPNWWLGLPQTPMLLLSGQNLGGASVTVSYPGIQITRIETPPDGRYIFLWLSIASETRPGVVPITVKTTTGIAVANLALLARQPTAGKFQGLSPGDVIYLIMPDRFADGDPSNNEPPQSPGTYDRSKPRAYHGGDIRGIINHLPYLRDLGVTTLWLTPLYDNDNASPNDYHGYGAVDFYTVDEHFGTLMDVQELVQTAHQQEIKVFLDVVVNHTGPRHPWVKALPMPDWFHGTPESHGTSRGKFDALADPHAVPQQYENVLNGWFAGKLPDLNQENPLVAQYLLANAIWWIESTGLDGFRLDTFPYVSRRFWADWHDGIFRVYPRFVTIGEVFNSDPSVVSFFTGGRAQYDGIDSRVTTVFDFPTHFALSDVVIRGAPVKRLVDVLQRDWMYRKPDSLVTFIGNHDVRRFISEDGSSKQKLKLAFALLLTLRGIPQMYAGDEIGMPGGGDPDNRRDFPGGFPGDPRNAFTATGRTADEQEIFSHVQSLIGLRRSHPALCGGRQWHIAWDDISLAFLRETAQERLLVVFNNADQPRTIGLNLHSTPIADARRLEPVFAAASAVLVQDAAVELPLPPMTVAIYQVK